MRGSDLDKKKIKKSIGIFILQLIQIYKTDLRITKITL